MPSPESIGGAIGGFVAGFGCATALVRLLIGKAVAELITKLPAVCPMKALEDERQKELDRRIGALEARRDARAVV